MENVLCGGAQAAPCAEVKIVHSEVDNLKDWQKSQNGAIHRVEDKVAAIDKKFDDKITSFERALWLSGLGIVANLAIGLLMLALKSGGN